MIYVVGHKNPDTDSICSAMALAYFLDGLPAKLGPINLETAFVLRKFQLSEPLTIESVFGRDFFLVDHAEKSQAIENLDHGRLLGIIDHHKLGIFTTDPIVYICKPLGSTASIIAELYFRQNLDYIGAKNKEMPEAIAGILLSAILSDTVVFKSLTTTDMDKSLAIKLAEIAKVVDIYAYGMEMLKAKSSIVSLLPEEIFNVDYKEFLLNGKKIGISQIELIDVSELLNKKNQIQELIQKKLRSSDLDLILFIITDIIREGSEIIVFGNTGAFEKSFGVNLFNNAVFIDGLMSRKKQVVPVLAKYYNEI